MVHLFCPAWCSLGLLLLLPLSMPKEIGLRAERKSNSQQPGSGAVNDSTAWIMAPPTFNGFEGFFPQETIVFTVNSRVCLNMFP